MTYKLLANAIFRLADEAVIPIDPANRDFQEYSVWLNQGNTPEPADPPSPPPPDWSGFLAAVKSTSVFSNLRQRSRANVTDNAIATELRTLLGEAALGLVDADAVQEILDGIGPTFTPPERQGLQDLFTIYRIPLTLEGGA